MSFSIVLKEKIARVIAEYFTTNQIVNVFTDANIPTDKSLFAKWRIILDGFSKMSDPKEGILRMFKVFCHPLNFEDNKRRKVFINELNDIISYEHIQIQDTDEGIKIVSVGGGPQYDLTEDMPTTKTSIDHVIEAINFFKNEYNKVRISGLAYEYALGENINSEQIENGREEYGEKLEAIEQLKNVGLITEYEIKDKVEAEGYYVWDYAVCKIDESKLTQKEEPKATEESASILTKKVIHEHTHRFENSIQEKDIDLNHKFNKNESRNKKTPEGKFPYKIPAGTSWESIVIKFHNTEAATVEVVGKSHLTGYADMGFVDNRKHTPNLQWGLLLLLARKGGELSSADADAQEKYKKHKQLLSERLRSYFNMQSDPMEPYKGGYKIRMVLVPPPEAKREVEKKTPIEEYLA